MKFDPIVLKVQGVRRQIFEARGCDFKKMARAVTEQKIPGSRPIIPALPTTASGSGTKQLQHFSFFN
jgi:hypothetical protein